MSQQINLFNPDFLKQKRYFSVSTMLQAIGMIVLGAGALYGYAAYQMDILARQAAELGNRHAMEQLRLASLSREFAPEKTVQMLQEELKQTESAASAQAEILETVKNGVLGNADGYSEYLRAFARQAVGGLWLTGFVIEGDGVDMTLSGAALNPQLVPAYIRRLGKEPVMQGRTFSSLRIQLPLAAAAQPVGYVEFRIQSGETRGETK